MSPSVSRWLQGDGCESRYRSRVFAFQVTTRNLALSYGHWIIILELEFWIVEVLQANVVRKMRDNILWTVCMCSCVHALCVHVRTSVRA